MGSIWSERSLQVKFWNMVWVESTAVGRITVSLPSAESTGSAMVSDWNYMSGGQMHGSYTTRVAIKKLSPTQVRELGLKLAPLP